MSPRPLGRLAPYLALLAALCHAAQASVVQGGSGQVAPTTTPRPHLNRTESVGAFPNNMRKKALVSILQSQGLHLTADVPNALDLYIPRLIESLVNGAADDYLPTHPTVKNMLAPIVQEGIAHLMQVFGSGNVYITDTPPVIACPESIRQIADKGRSSAVVWWSEPKGYDIEDGVLTPIRSGRAPGSRFSGSQSVQYNVADSGSGSDFCRFQITVKVVKCPLIPLADNRHRSCQGYMLYGDSCEFSCDVGYALTGYHRIECQKNGTHSHHIPTCVLNTCNEPPMVPGGASWQCTNEHFYKSTCTINCKPGFRNVRTADRTPWDQATITCRADGTWTRLPVCKDVTAPVITNCPTYVKEYADRGRRSAVVTWDTVVATDASGGTAVVRQIRGLASGSRFLEGAHQVAYEAVDDAQLSDHCIFYVNVEVANCPIPIESNSYMQITCNEGFAYGSTCTIVCLHQITLQGSSSMSCERVSGQMEWKYPQGPPVCLAKPCPELRAVANGQFTCHMYSSSRICTLDCNDGYLPARNTEVTSATCIIATGAWTRTHFAGCVKRRNPLVLDNKFAAYWRSTCDPSASDVQLPDVATTVTPLLKQESFFQTCEGCRVADVRAQCISYRGVPAVYLTWSIQHDYIADMEIKETISASAALQKIWLITMLRNTDSLHWHATATRKVLYNDRGVYSICAPSHAPSPPTSFCAGCGPGTIFENDKCTPCPLNTYQDDSGDGNTCTPCPQGSTTTGIGKGHKEDCKSPCPIGTDSESGMTPCRKCPIGEYNDQTGQTACKLCPIGRFTPTTGATTASVCYIPASEVIRFQVANYGPDFVRFTWLTPDNMHGEHHGYFLKYTKRSETIGTNVTVKNDTTTHEFDNLQSQTDYTFTIAALNEFGSGVPRSIHLKTKMIPTTTTTTTTPAPTTTEDIHCPAGTSSYNGLKASPGGCIKCFVGFYQPLTGQTGCNVCQDGFTTWYVGSTQPSDCVDDRLVSGYKVMNGQRYAAGDDYTYGAYLTPLRCGE